MTSPVTCGDVVWLTDLAIVHQRSDYHTRTNHQEVMASSGKHPKYYFYVFFSILFDAKNLRKTEKILISPV